MQGVSAGSAWEVQLWKGEKGRAGRSWSAQLGRLCIIPHTVIVTQPVTQAPPSLLLLCPRTWL